MPHYASPAKHNTASRDCPFNRKPSDCKSSFDGITLALGFRVGDLQQVRWDRAAVVFGESLADVVPGGFEPWECRNAAPRAV